MSRPAARGLEALAAKGQMATLQYHELAASASTRISA